MFLLVMLVLIFSFWFKGVVWGGVFGGDCWSWGIFFLIFFLWGLLVMVEVLWFFLRNDWVLVIELVVEIEGLVVVFRVVIVFIFSVIVGWFSCNLVVCFVFLVVWVVDVYNFLVFWVVRVGKIL